MSRQYTGIPHSYHMAYSDIFMALCVNLCVTTIAGYSYHFINTMILLDCIIFPRSRKLAYNALLDYTLVYICFYCVGYNP